MATSEKEMLDLLFSDAKDVELSSEQTTSKDEEDENLSLLFGPKEQQLAEPTVPDETEEALTPTFPSLEEIPTTIDQLYYSDGRGQQIKAKEENAKTILRMQSADPTLTEKQIIDAKRDVQEVLEYKESVFNKIQGENVTDLGFAGKLITNPDGSRKLVPGPYASPVTQYYAKTISDTLRGILSLPEAIAGKKIKKDIQSLQIPELVPEVNTDNPYVETLSEVTQLGIGAFSGLGLATKAKKYAEYAGNLPQFKNFIKKVGDEFDYLAGPRTQMVAKGIKDSAETIATGVLPKGTIPTSIGAAVVADDDVATFFGDPDATIGEVKMQVLKESLLFGVAFNAVKGVGEITRVTPALKVTSAKISGAISALLASRNPTKADERVIEALAETVLNTSKRLSNPENTADDIARINLEMFEETKTAYSQLSGGGDLEKVIQGIDAPLEGGPTLSELLGEKALMRLEQALMTQTGSKKQASEVLRTVLGDADLARQQNIRERVLSAGEELAPRGREAGEEAAEELRPALEQEVAGLETAADVQTRAAVQQTDAALAQAERRSQQVIEAEQQGIESVQTIADETAETVQRTLERSNLSTTNLDELNNVIDSDGAILKINEVLKKDLEIKDQLGKAKDVALRDIEISGEEAQEIVDTLIGTYTNPSFLVGDDAIQNAGKALGQLIRTFKSQVDDVPPGPTRGPTPPGPTPPVRPMDQKLAELVLEAETATDPTRFLAIAREIQDLTRRGAKMPKDVPAGATPSPVAQEALEEGAEEAVELPTITALDLERIAIETQQRASKLKSVAQKQSDQRAMALGDGLSQYAKRLTEIKNTKVAESPVAKEADEAFTTFFNEKFKETWRTETGREWQGQIIGSKARADILGVEEKIINVVKNPKASAADKQLVRELLSRMPDDARQDFIQSIGTRIVADFASAKGVMPSETADLTVKQATQLLDRVNDYLNKNSSYNKTIPGVFDKLTQIRNDLEAVVSPARSAQEAAKTASKASAQTIKAAEQQLKKETSELTSTQKDTLRSIERRLDSDIKAVNSSAVAKMLNVDDPTQHIETLFTKADGFKQYQDIWNKAASIGETLPSGLTPTQEALQESLTFALLNKVYPTTARELADTPAGLKEIARVIADPKSTPGRMFQLAFDKNPQGMQVLENLEKTIARYTEKRSVSGLGARGSTTFEKQVLSKMVDDVFMVMYGPLTQDFRQARFLNRIFFGAFDGDYAVAEAFTRVLTDERYTKMVLDKAAELARNKLITPEEAFRSSFGATLLAAAGIKKYYQSDDPDRTIQEDLARRQKQMAIAVESEEGLGAEPNPQ